MTVTLKIGGMSCMHCVKAVKGALQGVAGIESAQVEVGSAVITAAEGTSVETIKSAIEEEGYEVISVA